MTRYVLALDQGTTSSRAIVFGRDGRAVAAAQQELPQIFPRPGEVEHDPEAIWSTQLAVAREALARAGMSAARRWPPSASPTSARPPSSGTAHTGRPVAQRHRLAEPGQRAALRRAEERTGTRTLFRAQTGLVLDAYFSGTKIKHLLDTIPGLRARAEKGDVLFGTVDTFLIWRLTGGRCTSPTSATPAAR